LAISILAPDIRNRYDDNSMFTRKLFFGVYFFLLGILVVMGALIHSSGQKPIDPNSLTGLYSPDESVGIFHDRTVSANYVPQPLSAIIGSNILGATTNSFKRIEVDLTSQKLYAFDGNTKVFDFLISSGKWGKTPTGVFNIWSKFRFVKMEGGNKLIGTYYNLPNVPYTMFFANKDTPPQLGFGIHGTYWHSNFGHPMSHGCINMKTEEAEKLYYWADPDLSGKPSILASSVNPGTQVVIYGNPPDN
jgi:hypothetical protein